ncbi:hypothetical protein [Actinoalloteichus spitiensis]|uniref:hypothetical protein n=1 Tax=Actinoalloteichus spitiensis TaxID=252394 RepID=UPI00036B4036|nr:hypothetical protein [Actinoalloteichus spitiensis]
MMVPQVVAAPAQGAGALFTVEMPGTGPMLMVDLGSLCVQVRFHQDGQDREHLDRFLAELTRETSRALEWLRSQPRHTRGLLDVESARTALAGYLPATPPEEPPGGAHHWRAPEPTDEGEGYR